ncbi:hypothetical protein BDY19DRAFT_576011 [Irpex rosettiformis]|uniref:Uncharacterized protein n=1 Tax=Irpex rosettiformis TaxID=378272 RepID=A0ACB8UCH9_9APHY|nr:hypothetical protein BDY19DRAFT_576011 [Irpex rosettiformis]
MPTITVNDDGAVLYYEDSGAPNAAQDYHTIFIVHGFIFHGGSFRPLFTHASSQRLRLILVNQREYPGSSPLNDNEMSNLWSQEPKNQAIAIGSHATELATFIARFIEENNIPPPDFIDGKVVGGISLLAWSQGNGPLMSLLANIPPSTDHTSILLGRYIRTVFMYDPPSMVLGIPSSPKLVMPVHDPKLSEEEKPEKFIDWVSGYWEALRTPDIITTEALLKRSDVYDSTGNHKYLNTAKKLQKSEVDSLVAPNAYSRVGATLSLAHEVYAKSLRLALFDTNGHWDHLRVVAIWPDMSVWPCLLAFKGLTEMLQDRKNDGAVKRELEIVQLPETNHMYHYEEPDKTAWKRRCLCMCDHRTCKCCNSICRVIFPRLIR